MQFSKRELYNSIDKGLTSLTVSDSIHLEHELKDRYDHTLPGNKLFFHELIPDSNVTIRFFDVLFASVILMLTLPLWPFMWLGVKLTSAGSFFETRKYVGFRGFYFTGRQIRTRVKIGNKHISSIELSSGDYPPFTKFGMFLNKTGLSRLPLLINVLKGDMSFVGNEMYEEDRALRLNNEISSFYKAFAVKPGLVAYSSVYGNSTGGNDVENARSESASNVQYALNYSTSKYFKVLFFRILGLTVNSNVALPKKYSQIRQTNQSDTSLPMGTMHMHGS